VGSHGQVWTVEVDADLAQSAARRLAQVIGSRVSVHVGNGLKGYAPGVPYDRILATGSTSTVPLPWLEQVRPGGIILMNLIGEMGACAFLKLVKQETGLAARGHFLSRSEFMELYEAGTYPPRRAALVGQYIARPVTMRQSCTRADFDLSVLWERVLDVALQLSFPQMSFTSAYVNPPCPCLIDRATDTMLLLRPTGEEQFQVEIRGDPSLWEQVKATYHQWVACGRPDVTAYRVQIDACGKQQVILPSFSGSTETYTWMLGARVT
jgi:protein-L-isoaspartate O-methyltransferase